MTTLRLESQAAVLHFLHPQFLRFKTEIKVVITVRKTYSAFRRIFLSILSTNMDADEFHPMLARIRIAALQSEYVSVTVSGCKINATNIIKMNNS